MHKFNYAEPVTPLFAYYQNTVLAVRCGKLIVHRFVWWTPDRAVLVRDLAVSLPWVLGRVTLFSQCLSSPRFINGYRRSNSWDKP